MKGRIIMFLSCQLLFTIASFANQIIVDSNIHVLKNGSSPLSAGDTIFFDAGPRGRISVWDYQGSVDSPIVVTAIGAMSIWSNSNYTLDFYNCKHVKLTGKIPGVNYGIEIDGGSAAEGIRFFKGSSFIEIENVHVHHVNTGIKAKSSLSRDTFLQESTYIHHNYIHDVNTEGLYIGGSFYHSSNEHLLKDVQIHDNRIEHTGWDAIQVGSASWDCQVYNNYIQEDSYAMQSSQMSGIMINPGSDCDCWNNIIVDGYGPGIFYQGNGWSNIYNNRIINAGKASNSADPRGGDGIAVWGGDSRWWSIGADVYVFHNTIIRPQNNGITFAFKPGYQGDSSIIQNNIIIEPNGTYYSDTMHYRVENYLGASYIDGGNYYSHTWQNDLFVDSIFDLHLSDNAAAIDFGIVMADSFQLADIDGDQRAFEIPDAGADEFYSLPVDLPSTAEYVGVIWDGNSLKIPKNEFFALINMQGKLIVTIDCSQEYVSFSHLPKGMYFLKGAHSSQRVFFGK